MSSSKIPAQPVIREILQKCHTIAVVGLSSRKQRPGYYVPEYLQAAGYRIIPVNPELENALGEKAYPDLASVPEQIDLVLIFRRSEFVPPIVKQAIAVGARAVWMQQGILHEAAAVEAQAAGLLVVMDACMMVEHRRFSANP
jgi:predicted CoA-binding protein